jgi:hypothetical protein
MQHHSHGQDFRLPHHYMAFAHALRLFVLVLTSIETASSSRIPNSTSLLIIKRSKSLVLRSLVMVARSCGVERQGRCARPPESRQRPAGHRGAAGRRHRPHLQTSLVPAAQLSRAVHGSWTSTLTLSSLTPAPANARVTRVGGPVEPAPAASTTMQRFG